MKAGPIFLNLWFFGTVLGVQTWLYGIGDFAAGSWNWAGFAIAVLLPVSLCRLIFAVLRGYAVARSWHLATAVLATVLVYPLMFQWWNPRCVFVH